MASFDELLRNAEAQRGLPTGLLSSLVQQETGGQRKYLDKPDTYHYAPNAKGVRVAGHTGKVSTAFGPFGLLESTAAKPGYGVAPLKNKTLEEQARFAADYVKARIDKAGDVFAGLAGYGEGAKYAEKVLSRITTDKPFKVTGSNVPASVEQRIIVNNTPINQPLPQLKEPERYSDLLAKKVEEYQASKINNMGYGTYTPTDMEAVKGMVEPVAATKSDGGVHPLWFNFGNAFGGGGAAPVQKSKGIFDWFGA